MPWRAHARTRPTHIRAHARALATSKLLSRSVRFAIFSLSRDRLRPRSPVAKTGPPPPYTERIRSYMYRYRIYICAYTQNCFCNASVLHLGPSYREIKKYPAGYLNRTLFVYRPRVFRAIKSDRNRFVVTPRTAVAARPDSVQCRSCVCVCDFTHVFAGDNKRKTLSIGTVGEL